MRLLHDARPLQESCPGGVTLVTQELMDTLIKQTPDWEHTLWTSGQSIPKLTIPTRAKQQHLRLPNKLLAFEHKLGFDIPKQLKSPNDLLMMYNLGFIGKPSLPYLQVVHDLSYLIEPTWYSFKSRLWHQWINPRTQLLNAAHLFAVSETTKQDLMRLLQIPSQQITVIPLSLPSSSRTKSDGDLGSITASHFPQELKGKRYALLMGNGNSRKNIDCILSAWTRWEQENNDTWLVLIGGEKTSKLKRVIQYPWRTNLQQQALLQNAGLLLYPSWYEGYGLPIHEADALDIPTIASCDSCLSETKPARTQLLPPSKPHLWLTALRATFSAPQLIKTTHAQPLSWTDAADLITETIQHLH